MLADATYTGEKSDAPAAAGRGLPPELTGHSGTDHAFLLPYPELAAAAAGFGHNYLSLDADGPVRHTVPFVRSNGRRAMPRSAWRPRSVAGGIPPAQVALDDGRLTACADRDAAVASLDQNTRTGNRRSSWRLINFRGPPLLDDLKSRPYAELLVFRSALFRGTADSPDETPKVDPAVFKDKIVFVGVTASGLFDVFETPFRARQDAGHAGARRRGRRYPVESVHRPGDRLRARVASVLAIGVVVGVDCRMRFRRGGPPSRRWLVMALVTLDHVPGVRWRTSG